MKSKKTKNDSLDLEVDLDLDFESEFNIKNEDIKFLIDTHEKGNVKILKHHMKKIDESIDKIEDGLLEIIYTVDDIIEKYKEGKIFKSECSQALDKLLILADFVRKMENEFNDLKETRDTL